MKTPPVPPEPGLPPPPGADTVESNPRGLPTRTFLNKLLWSSGTYGLRLAVSILTVYLVTHFLKVQSYGVYGQAQAVGLLLGQLAGFGMSRRLTIWLLQHPEGRERASAFWSSVLCVWLLGLACLAVGIPLLARLYPWLDPAVGGLLLAWITLGEVARQTLNLVQIQLDWDESVRARLLLDVSSMALPALLGCGLLVGFSLGIEGFVAGLNVASVLIMIGLVSGLAFRYRPVVDGARIREALRSGHALFGSNFCWSIIAASDRMFLSALGSGAASVGLYQLGAGAAASASGIASPFATLMVRHFFRGGRTERSQLVRPIVLGFLFPPLLALLAGAFAPVVFRFLVHPSYHPAFALVAPLVAANGLFLPASLLINVMLERGDYIQSLACEVSAVVVALLVNFALVPRLDAWGCVAALLATYLWLTCLVAWREGFLRMEGARAAAAQIAAVWALAGTAIAWVSLTSPPEQWSAGLLRGLGSLGLLAGLVVWRLRHWVPEGQIPALLQRLNRRRAGNAQLSSDGPDAGSGR